MSGPSPTNGPAPWDRPRCCADPEPCVEVRDLAVSYGTRRVLGGVDLDVPRGCITGIVGPSGCGKSTFLSTLDRMCDLVPGCRVAGSVRLDGEEILDRSIDVVALRRRVGMIFQRPNPFPFSVRRNLELPLREHGIRDRREVEERTEAALRDVGLWDEVADRLDAPALALSGGQQQRLCLARALVLRPEVLLLDEPCSALDPLASAVVEQLIAGLRGRLTIVVVTHNLAQARRLADFVALFWVHDGVGRIVEHASVIDFFGQPRDPLTRAYVEGRAG